MNISWLTLRDLEYVVALADHFHFGRASQACNISQPTLSAQIRKMEDVLDATLFERNNKRVAITDIGKRIVEQARVVLEEAEKIPKLAKKNQPLVGDFRLGAIATLGPFFVPTFLRQLREDYPDLRLMLKEGLTKDLIKDLKEGSLDAVLAARTFEASGLRVFPLFFEPFVLAAPQGHKLAKKAKVRVSDLRADDMVLLEDGHCLRNQALDFCPANTRGTLQSFHATGIETLRHMVASGVGYTLFPKCAAKESSLNGLVTYREFEESAVGREVVLVCRERYHRMEDIEHLARFLHR